MLVSTLIGLIIGEDCGMREIKFRAWSKNMGEFFIPKIFGHVRQDCEYTVFEQFTGLLDSTGVEIYEGDVILSEHDGSVVVEWSVRAAKFGVHVLRHHTYSIEKKTKLRAIPRDGIVIGNIHQNPEFLK
jgi:hypothetical protein